MIHDKVQLAVAEVRKLEQKLKDVKKDIKQEEKIEDESYESMKKSLRDLRGQVKDFEENHLEGLKSSDFYGKLREEKIKAEEDLALAKERLFALMQQLPLKAFEMDVDGEEGVVKVQALPELRLFVNGKEIKSK